MATLKVVGQHKGTITLNLDTATVLDLKIAVSSGSGLPVAGLKLLAGETRGPAEASVRTAAFCGGIACMISAGLGSDLLWRAPSAKSAKSKVCESAMALPALRALGLNMFIVWLGPANWYFYF